MPTTGVPVPGPKADGRKRSGAARAGSVGEDRSGRAGLEAAGIVHLTPSFQHPFNSRMLLCITFCLYLGNC